jgi:hypothetical protein
VTTEATAPSGGEYELPGRIDQLIGWAKSGKVNGKDGEDYYLMSAENVDRLRDDIIAAVARIPGIGQFWFRDRFTIIPGSGTTVLHCGSHAPEAMQWEVGYRPSLDVLIERARIHNRDHHGETRS